MGFLTRGSDSFGLPELVAVINSIVISSAISVALASLGGLSIAWPAFVGVITFIVGLLLHSVYHNRRVEAAEASAVVHFPAPKAGPIASGN